MGDSAIWAIVENIVEGCEDDGHTVSPELAAITMKYVYQNPKFGFDPGEPLDSDEVRRLINVARDAIVQDRDPVMETLRMQVQFAANYSPHSDVIAAHNRQLEAKLSPLLKEIVEFPARTKKDFEFLYGRIVTSVILRSGLGNPTNRGVERETNLALQSVFPMQALHSFVAQTHIDKRTQLRELTAVTTGIRVFNWDGRKGGAGMEDLPSLISSAIESALNNAEAMRVYAAEKADKLTSVVEAITFSEAGGKVGEKERAICKFGLLNLRQFQAYLGVLLEETAACNNRLAKLDQELLGNLTELQKNVASKFSLPTEEVFPQFVHLAATWKGFQEETVVLSRLTATMQALHSYTNCLKRIRLKELYETHVATAGRRRRRRKQSGSGSSVSDLDVGEFDPACTVVTGGDVDDAKSESGVQYAGFCPVALVAGHGYLEPGDERLGLLTYGGKAYTCSSVERAAQFGRHPRLYVQGVEKIAREYPCFSRLLRMDDVRVTAPKMTLCDEAVQTPVHFPPPRHVDPGYRWNEWDLRRDALHLATLHNKATHSAQTSLTAGRRHAATATVTQGLPSSSLSSRGGLTTEGTQTAVSTVKKSIVVGLKSEKSNEVEHVLLEDLLAAAI